MKLKVYIWKKDNIVYAFTINKKLKEDFDITRNKGYFNSIGYSEFSKEQFKSFQSKNYNKMIFLNPLYNGKKYINVPTTYEEDNILTEKCETLSSLRDKYNSHNNIFFKGRYQKVISDMLNISELTKINGNIENLYTINTFAIFTKLFSDSF